MVRKRETGLLEVKEILAAAPARCREMKVKECSVDISVFTQLLGKDAVTQSVLGLELEATAILSKEKKEEAPCCFQLERVSGLEGLEELIEEAQELAGDILCQGSGKYAGEPSASHGSGPGGDGLRGGCGNRGADLCLRTAARHENGGSVWRGRQQ